MSESMAFIGGVAVAGLAALLLLKGTGNSAQPNFGGTPQMQAPVVGQPMIQPQPIPYPGQPYANFQPPGSQNPELQAQIERQKSQLEFLQRENDQLRNQSQQLQTDMQSYYKTQLSAQQSNSTAQQEALGQSQTTWWSSGIIWAVGGMALTVGGGIVVAGVSALFVQKPRQSRTVQVIHPYNGSSQSLSPVRRAEFLPPRSETRRVEAPEYDDTY